MIQDKEKTLKICLKAVKNVPIVADIIAAQSVLKGNKPKVQYRLQQISNSIRFAGISENLPQDQKVLVQVPGPLLVFFL